MLHVEKYVTLAYDIETHFTIKGGVNSNMRIFMFSMLFFHQLFRQNLTLETMVVDTLGTRHGRGLYNYTLSESSNIAFKGERIDARRY